MSEYSVTVWCRDCTGEDYAGCFDGGVEFLYYDPSDPNGYSRDGGRYFADKETADAAGFHATKDCGPWTWKAESVTAAQPPAPLRDADRRDDGG